LTSPGYDVITAHRKKLIKIIGEKMNFAEKVAGNMEKGLNNELREICEIGRVLRDVEELSKTQVNYFMSIDEDFIPDVLQFYNGGK